MFTQSQIDRKLDQIKAWYWQHGPLCIFCGHEVWRKEGGHLAHLIRISESLKLQMVKLNTGLSHHDFHEIFDDSIQQAVYQPRILECLYIIYFF